MTGQNGGKEAEKDVEDKIMAGGNLEEILNRLTGCRAVLDVIHEAAQENPLKDAIAGACDMLRSICMDFEADISAAEDYPEQAEK